MLVVGQRWEVKELPTAPAVQVYLVMGEIANYLVILSSEPNRFSYLLGMLKTESGLFWEGLILPPSRSAVLECPFK